MRLIFLVHNAQDRTGLDRTAQDRVPRPRPAPRPRTKSLALTHGSNTQYAIVCVYSLSRSRRGRAFGGPGNSTSAPLPAPPQAFEPDAEGMVVLLIDGSDVGRLLGKKGATIEQLREQSGQGLQRSLATLDKRFLQLDHTSNTTTTLPNARSPAARGACRCRST